MNEADKYDEQAKELLPCSWGCDEHTRSCTAYFRSAVAAALREMGDEIERLRNGYDYTGVQARACPGCVYEAGVFVRHCALHARIEQQNDLINKMIVDAMHEFSREQK
jgi:hypothetical protein